MTATILRDDWAELFREAGKDALAKAEHRRRVEEVDGPAPKPTDKRKFYALIEPLDMFRYKATTIDQMPYDMGPLVGYGESPHAACQSLSWVYCQALQHRAKLSLEESWEIAGTTDFVSV